MYVDIECPYCDTIFPYNLDNRFTANQIYVQPSISPQYTKFFWKFICPESVISEYHRCNNCGNYFNFIIFANDDNYVNYLRQSWLWNGFFYYYDILLGHPHPQKKTVHEKTYNSVFNFYGSPVLDNIIGISFIIYIIIAYVLYAYSLSQKPTDLGIIKYSPIIVTFIATILSIILLGRFFNQTKKEFNCNNLRYKISKRYQQTNSCRLFEEISLRGSIFGPQGLLQISLPTICGIIFVILYFSPSTTNSLLELPSNILFAFIIGSIIYYTLAISMFLFFDIQIYGLSINPLTRFGGVEAYGDIFLKSVYPVITYVSGFLISLSIEFYLTNSINYNTIIPILLFLLLFSYIFASFVLLEFFMVLYMVHREMIKVKVEELKRLEQKIASSNISIRYFFGIRNWRLDDDLILFFNTYYKINDMREWPFETNLINTLWNIFTLVILPIFAIIITIYSIIHPNQI